MTEQSGGQAVALTVQSAEPLRILIADVETTPLLVWAWSAKPDYISYDFVERESNLLCWAAKWSDGKRVLSDKQTSDEAKAGDDARIVDSLAQLVRQADIVLAHNADRFDIPKVNARLLLNGLEPMPPVETIDTLKLSKRSFGVAHHNLDAWARRLGLRGKIKTDFQLWLDCMSGSEVAMQRMVRYCRNDVAVLGDVFDLIRPYVRGLRRLMDGEGSFCPYCGSRAFESRGTRHTNAGTQQRYHCLNKDCGRYFHHKTSDANKRDMRVTP